MISDDNFGFLNKIDWNIASRTDKKVSAVMNVISCKLLKFTDNPEEEIKFNLNNLLPKDIIIHKVIEMSQTFISRHNNSREYHYILPSYIFKPNDFSKRRNSINTINALSASNVLSYDISNIPDYSYTITSEFHKKFKSICEFYNGVNNYHNFTKKINFKDDSAKRLIYTFNCDELINLNSFECIKFTVIGQSFLYNQIRKMIGK